MDRQALRNKYFNWLRNLAGSTQYRDRGRKLLDFLFSVDFTYTIPMDGNRYEDGIDLRYRFGKEHGINDQVIASLLDDRPCSVLEMMIALAIRIEEHIMGDPEIGDRTGEWFKIMLDNLRIGYMMNGYSFNKRQANVIIKRFLNRKYDADGWGGLFVLQHCERDVRDIEIWYQAMWYLDEVLNIR